MSPEEYRVKSDKGQKFASQFYGEIKELTNSISKNKWGRYKAKEHGKIRELRSKSEKEFLEHLYLAIKTWQNDIIKLLHSKGSN